MKPHIIYIHGANSTPRSFNYIKSQLPEHTSTNVVYNANEPIDDLILAAVKSVDQPGHIIAHSLGGVIGAAISQAYPNSIQSLTTISTPFGGSEAANRFAMLLPFSTFLKNIRPGNPILRGVTRTGQKVPTLTIITTSGHAFFEHRPNDGVVTVESQEAFQSSHRVHVDMNHFEVLQDPTIVDTIRNFMEAHHR